MTGEQISRRSSEAEGAARWAILADLAYWTVAGAIGAALSETLGKWWGITQGVLLAVGLAFLVGGAGLLYALNRIRPTPRQLVRGFVVSNLVLAPLAWATALTDWLRLNPAGNWAVGCAGGIALVLGTWQLIALQRLQRAAHQ